MRLRAFSTVLASALAFGAACSSDAPVDGSSGGTGASAGSGGSSTSPGGGGDEASGAKAGGGKGGGGKTGGTGPSNSPAGAGGEAGEHCPGCDSGFCLEDGTCVDCLPSDDQCPAGRYCTDANVCAKGCKDGPSCASGSCNDDHSCERCISDDECQGDDLCNSGRCGAACSKADEGEPASCEDGLTCCSLHCVALTVDSNHCGACGTACGDGQFCGLDSCDGSGGAGGASGASCVGCHDVTFASVCAIGQVVVILDSNKNPSDGNRVPGRAVGAALEAQCDPTPSVSEAEQDSVGALNFTTGRPVSRGGELLVVAGGNFYQNLEGYVEQSISPLYVEIVDGKQQLVSRASGDVVARDSNDGNNDSHDFFALQFMRDPASGSLVLNLQGFWLSGTQAASFFLVSGVLPDLASFDKAWYVYEWTDANDDQQPDLEEIALVDSGR